MSFRKFHMLYLLASAAVWMLTGSDMLTADTDLTFCQPACIPSDYWLHCRRNKRPPDTQLRNVPPVQGARLWKVQVQQLRQL